MIHMKKPAKHYPSKETIKLVNTRDDYTCQRCGIYVGETQPHHWGLHNNGPNRKKYPLLVHHPANLIIFCSACHQKYGSGDNLPDYRAGAIELVLAAGGDCYLDIDTRGNLSIITKPLKGEIND